MPLMRKMTASGLIIVTSPTPHNIYSLYFRALVFAEQQTVCQRIIEAWLLVHKEFNVQIGLARSFWRHADLVLVSVAKTTQNSCNNHSSLFMQATFKTSYETRSIYGIGIQQ